MRHSMGVICLAAMLLPACAPPPESAPEPKVDLKAEEEALRKFLDEVRVAYTNRDSKAMAGMFDETMMTLSGFRKGREAIEEFWANFLGSLGNTQINILEEISLEFVTPEVAIYQTRIEFTNQPPDADGNPQPPQEYFAANVYVKRDGLWLRKGAFLRSITDE